MFIVAKSLFNNRSILVCTLLLVIILNSVWVTAAAVDPAGEAPQTAVTETADHNLYDDALAELTADQPRFDLAAYPAAAPLASHVGGEWGEVIVWPHTPVSIANLPDGNILTWSGSERTTWPNTEQTYSAVWNPTTNSFVENFYEGHNMFCSELLMLEDGRIIAMGGRNTVDMVSAYDFSTDTWTPLESMNTNRWYPTAMTLGNGDVFIAAGKGGRYPERYSVGDGWSLLTGADIQGPILNYGTNKDGAGWWPLMHLDPRGQIFHYGATPQMHSIDPTGNGAITPLGANNFSWFPEEAVAIMYDEGKILVAGGAIDSGTNTSSPKTAVIDITGPTPVVTETASMNIARQFQNEVVLPTGEVLVLGGNTSGQKFSDDGAVLEPEIWDPATQTWTLGNPMDVPRNYHSTGILLADGRVLSAGGGYSAGNANHPATHTDGQVYSPAYLFNTDGTLAPRPAITAAPAKISSGDIFTVETSADIDQFTMVRMSATTHTMNTGQRLVKVPFTGSGGNYQLTAHSNTNILVPGYWMLFALDSDGVPSVSHIVQVNSSGKPWIVAPDNTATLTGVADSHTVSAGDTDGDTLTFTASNLPPGITINANTGEMSGTPNTTGNYNIAVTVTDGQLNSRTVSFTWSIIADGIVREWWNGIDGTTIADLTNSPNYPDNPTGSEYLNSFEGPTNNANNYGSRIHGYIVPPETGNYTFWIASDDNGELWLSNGDDPSNATLIANVPGWSASRQWTKFPDQQSAVIPLIAGKKYYMSALMKEGGGGDNLAVAWQRPGSTEITVIGGEYASPYQKPLLGDWRYVKFVATSEVNGNPWASAAELNMLDTEGSVISRGDWVITASSEEEADGTIERVLDGNPNTIWHTDWRTNAGTNNDPSHPHEVIIDMGEGYNVGGFRYLPRQNGVNGNILGYQLYVSLDQTEWVLVDEGNFPNNAQEKVVTFDVDPPLLLKPQTAVPQLINTQIDFIAESVGGEGTVEYQWSFGDGQTSSWGADTDISHTYTQPGRYLVNLTARDADGTQDSIQFVQAIHRQQTAVQPTHSTSIVYETRGAGDRLWNVNPDNNTVSVVDVATNSKAAEIAVGNNPQTLAIAPDGRVWVTNLIDGSISIISPNTLAVVNTINLGRGTSPYGLVFSPTNDAAYVALSGTGQLLKLDPSTGATLNSTTLSGKIRHLSMPADGATVYVSRFITPRLPGEETAVVQTTGVGGEVVAIETSAMTERKTLIVQVDNGSDFEAGARGVPNYLSAMVISPDGTSAWVPSKEDNIFRGGLRDGNDLNFEHTVRAVSSYIDMGTEQENFAFRVDHDNSSVARTGAFGRYGNYFFVALETSREISVVDAYSRAELFRIGAGLAPRSVVVAPDGLTLYVHNFMDRTVGVYDLSTLMSSGVYSAPWVANIGTVASEQLANNVLTGKQLFYDAADTRLAMDGYLSCAACHQDGGDDGRVWDFTGFGEGLRNTIALNGHGGPDHGPMHWTANFNEIHDFEGQIRSLNLGTGLMSNTDFASSSDPLGADKAGLSADLDAMVAYVNSLTSVGESPHRANDGSLTADGEAGKTLFNNIGCATCHTGAAFTDSALNQLHDVGTLKVSSGNRIGGLLNGLDTPTLRGVWDTAPYLHDGSAATINEAINAHNGVSLTNTEVDQLVSFLNQLDDQEPISVSMNLNPQPAGLEFSWGNTGSTSCAYHLYEEATPYFAMDGVDATDISSPYTMDARTNDSASHYFYRLQAVCNGVASNSDEMGVFTFDLAAGQ